MRRRLFVSAASLTALGLTRPEELTAQAAAPKDEPRAIPRYPQDAWFDKLPGKHRLFLDATNAEEAGGAVGYGWNFMRTSQTGYNLKDADLAVVICLRHEATLIAFSNDLFHKYDALGDEKYKHPESGKKISGGNVFRPGSKKPESYPDGFTLDGASSMARISRDPLDLVAQAIGRLLRRSDDGAALALEAAKERVGEAPNEDRVARRSVFRRGLLLVEELLQIDRLARAERDVPVVGEELPEGAEAARPLAGPEEHVEHAALALVGKLRPNERLRDEEDGALGGALEIEERAQKWIALAATAERRLEDARRPLQEEDRRRAALDGSAQIVDLGADVFGRERL